jgi:ABC-type nitrate/sulfonate/bicarbonate transport system substrate-binding protein
MRQRHRGWTQQGVVFVVILVVLLAGLGFAVREARAAETVRILYPAGLDLEKGGMLAGWDLFLKHIKVEPVVLRGQNSVARALLSGKENVGYLTFSVFASVVAKGGELVVLAVSEQHLVWALVATTDIQTIEDLKGKRVCAHAPAGISASIVDYYAAKTGAKRSDFQMMYIRGGENRIAALLAGKVDATPATLVDANEALNTGKFHVLSVFSEEAPEVVGPMLVATPKFVNEHPELVQQLVTAAVKGMRLAYEDPERFTKAVKARAPYDNEALLQQGYRDFMKYQLWAKNGGAPLLETLQTSLEWFGKHAPGAAAKMGLNEGFRLTEAHVAPQFLEAALQELGRQ